MRESRASRTRNERPERQPSMKCASSRPTSLRDDIDAAVAAADGEPVRGVQHRQGQLLLGRPVLALDLQVGQPQPGHGDDGQRRVGAEQCRAAGGRRTACASGISAVSSSRLASSRPSSSSRPCRQATTSSRVDVSSAGTCRTACRSSGRGRTPPGRPAAAPASSRCPGRACGARPGRWRPRSRTPGRRPAPAAKCAALRGRDQRVRRERALLGAGQVEHPGVRPQLGHLRTAGPAGRTGRAG